SSLLGLTMACAQCHNHKFDPFTARDYYRFQGFFVKGQVANLALRDPQLVRAYEAARPPEHEPAVRLKEALFEGARAALVEGRKQALPRAPRAARGVRRDRRSPEQERLAREADLKFQFTANQVENALAAEDRKLYDELKKKLARIEKALPDRPQTFGFY